MVFSGAPDGRAHLAWTHSGICAKTLFPSNLMTGTHSVTFQYVERIHLLGYS